MILTVTMNPSIDTRYAIDHLVVDDVNRVVPQKTAGGKGLNVSRVLCQLGDDVVVTGLLGGHMGSFLADRMDDDGIPHDFVRIAGESRVCIAVLHDGAQTEFLESGPTVSADELAAFDAKFSELVGTSQCVTISGSLPVGIDAGYYTRLVAKAHAAGVPVLLDTSGASLDAVLAADVVPTLIKPNLSEINALLGTAFTPADVSELEGALKADERFARIPWVVVSMGAAGSVAFNEGRGYRVTTPPIEAVNATGSGDSTIAGMAHAIAAGMGPQDVLRYGNTCGKLNAMDPQTGHLAIEHWDEVFASIEVTSL